MIKNLKKKNLSLVNFKKSKKCFKVDTFFINFSFFDQIDPKKGYNESDFYSDYKEFMLNPHKKRKFNQNFYKKSGKNLELEKKSKKFKKFNSSIRKKVRNYKKVYFPYFLEKYLFNIFCLFSIFKRKYAIALQRKFKIAPKDFNIFKFFKKRKDFRALSSFYHLIPFFYKAPFHFIKNNISRRDKNLLSNLLIFKIKFLKDMMIYYLLQQRFTFFCKCVLNRSRSNVFVTVQSFFGENVLFKTSMGILNPDRKNLKFRCSPTTSLQLGREVGFFLNSIRNKFLGIIFYKDFTDILLQNVLKGLKYEYKGIIFFFRVCDNLSHNGCKSRKFPRK